MQITECVPHIPNSIFRILSVRLLQSPQYKISTISPTHPIYPFTFSVVSEDNRKLKLEEDEGDKLRTGLSFGYSHIFLSLVQYSVARLLLFLMIWSQNSNMRHTIRYRVSLKKKKASQLETVVFFYFFMFT